MGSIPWVWDENPDQGGETHWISGKKIISGAAVSKESDADSLLEHE